MCTSRNSSNPLAEICLWMGQNLLMNFICENHITNTVIKNQLSSSAFSLRLPFGSVCTQVGYYAPNYARVTAYHAIFQIRTNKVFLATTHASHHLVGLSDIVPSLKTQNL